MKAAGGIRGIVEKLSSTSKEVYQVFQGFEGGMVLHTDKLQESTERLIRESEQVFQVGEEIHQECASAGRQAADQQKQVKSELEKLTKMTSDLIGDLTGLAIVDLDPEVVSTRISEFEIIDVRKESEFNDELSHIEGARLVTLGKDLDDFMETADKAKTYLFVCRSGGRSSRAARQAQSFGIQNIFNLSGGMLEWNKHKLPTASRRRSAVA